jgi:hypothetical protein
MFKTFRRGQCFAIVSKRRPDKTEGTIYNRDFGLLRLEWFLERGPEEPFDYSDFEMYAYHPWIWCTKSRNGDPFST